MRKNVHDVMKYPHLFVEKAATPGKNLPARYKNLHDGGKKSTRLFTEISLSEEK